MLSEIDLLHHTPEIIPANLNREPQRGQIYLSYRFNRIDKNQVQRRYKHYANS